MKMKEINNLTDLISFKGNSKIERKAIFIGLVSSTILSKEIFKKNEDLKNYTEIFSKYTKSSEDFKKYIFASRTQVLAKVQRILLETLSEEQFDEAIKKHIYFIEKKNIEIKEGEKIKNSQIKNDSTSNSSLIKEMYKNRNRKRENN